MRVAGVRGGQGGSATGGAGGSGRGGRARPWGRRGEALGGLRGLALCPRFFPPPDGEVEAACGCWAVPWSAEAAGGGAGPAQPWERAGKIDLAAGCRLGKPAGSAVVS